MDRLFAILLIGILWPVEHSLAFEQGTVPGNQFDQNQANSFALIERAEYRIDFKNGALKNGTFTWELLQRGLHGGTIDLGSSNLNTSNLVANSQRVVWGTTQQDQRLVLVNHDVNQIRGQWNLVGRQFPGRTVYDFRLPPSVVTTLYVTTPKFLVLQSSFGIVTHTVSSDSPDQKLWKIELGRLRQTKLTITPGNLPVETFLPSVEIDTVHIARQDGVFTQAEFIIEGLSTDRRKDIEVQIPPAFDIQSVSSSGVPISYDDSNSDRRILRLELPDTEVSERVNFRIQGFKPVRWVRPLALPFFKLAKSIESRRTASVRVEGPLELRNVQHKGYFQTGLVDELHGEVWKFEAITESPQLIVDLGQPRFQLKTEIHSLNYYDTPLPWSVSKVTASVKSGQLFDLSFSIPAAWQIVSLIPLDSESEISSWTVGDNSRLFISFQEPLTNDSPKSFEVFVRSTHSFMHDDQEIPTLYANNSNVTSIQSDWILPVNEELDLSAGARWNRLTSEVDLSDFRQVPESVNKSAQQTRRSFFCSNVDFDSLPLVRFLSKNENTGNSETDSILTETPPQEGLATGDPDVEPSFDLHLLTQAQALGELYSSQLVHHADFVFFTPVTPDKLNLSLPADSVISSVMVNGKSVNVLRDGESIEFSEKIKTINTLGLIYITESERGFLVEKNSVPVPKVSFKTRNFIWELEIPGEHRLSKIKLPETSITDVKRQFYFGPLSTHFLLGKRGAISTPQHVQESEIDLKWNKEKHRFELITLYSTDRLQFETWNSVQALNFGWIAFLTCTLVGVGGKLTNSVLIRNCSPFWLLFLIAIQLFLYNEYSMIVGGMLAGTVISLLLPVEYLRLPDLAVQTAITKPIATASTLFLICCPSVLTGQDNTDAPSINTTQSYPAYLLRAVDYQLLETEPLQRFRAQLDVLTQPGKKDILVILPYQGVIFPSGAECQVDGQAHTLIPISNGNGVAVAVSNPVDDLSLPAEWNQHTIEFEFVLRKSDENPDDEPIRVKIPKVHHSKITISNELLLRDKFLLDQIIQQGVEYVRKGELIEIEVGPVDTLPSLVNRKVNQPVYLRMATQLNISKARITGQLFLFTEELSSDEAITISLPSKVIITGVTGGDVSQWVVSTDQTGQRHLIIERQRKTSNELVTVAFALPSSINTNDEIIVSKLPWLPDVQEQLIGLKVANGLSFHLPDSLATSLVDSKEWRELNLPGRSQPTHLFRIPQQESVRLQPLPVTMTKTHQLNESITVDRTSLSWQADIDLTVTVLPVFVHKFLLTKELKINAVRNVTGGEEKLLRFYQSGRQLSVFIPGGQLGRINLRIQGSAAFSPESATPLPAITVLDSEFISGTLKLTDLTNWDIELTMPGGTKLKRNSSPEVDFNANREIGQFSNEADTRPVHLILLPPPTAIRLDIATRVHVEHDRFWNSVQLLRFSGDETPLKQVNFVVSDQLENIRIGPRYFKQTIEQRESGQEYTIPIPERFAEGVTIQVYARIPQAVVQKIIDAGASTNSQLIPGVEVNSARIGSQFLLLNENRYVLPAPLQSVSMEAHSLPNWIPTQWQESILDLQLQAYQIIEGAPSLIPVLPELADKDSRVYLAETMIWPATNHIERGVSRFWVTCGPNLSLNLPFDKDIETTQAFTSDNLPTPIKQIEGQDTVEISSTQGTEVLTVYWKRKTPTPDQVTSPFVSGFSESTQSLVAVIESSQQARPIHSTFSLSKLDVLMRRRESLLKIVESLQVPLVIDSPLYQELGNLEKEITRALELQTPSERQLVKLRELDQSWDRLKTEMTLTVAPIFEDETSNKTISTLDFTSQTLYQRVTWFHVEEGNQFVVNLTQSQQADTNLNFWLHVLILMSILFVIFCYRKQTKFSISLIENNPVLRLLILGGLWLLFLRPIMIGFVLITFALTLQLSRSTTLPPSLSDRSALET